MILTRLLNGVKRYFRPQMASPRAVRPYEIGMWHQSIPKNVGKTEALFIKYCDAYISFIKKHNITRAFFLVQDPAIAPWCQEQALGSPWIVKHWLNQLPATCKAGFFLDANQLQYPWQGAKGVTPCTTGDSMDLAFQLVKKLNDQSTGQFATCISLDYESEKSYYSPEGQKWINSLWVTNLQLSTNDWGFAGAQTGITKQYSGAACYPEVYWVGEVSAACAKAGGGPACTGGNTDYDTFIGDPKNLYKGKLGQCIDTNYQTYAKPGVWPMFTVERFTDDDPKTKNLCINSYYQEMNGITKKNKCGVLNAFGVWTENDFFAWLDYVHYKQPTMDKVMIYQFNFIPEDWL